MQEEMKTQPGLQGEVNQTKGQMNRIQKGAESRLRVFVNPRCTARTFFVSQSCLRLLSQSSLVYRSSLLVISS